MLQCPVPRLETLESQTELIGRINDAVAGVTSARKNLQSLGTNPLPEQVEHVLQVDPCLT